MRPLKTKLKRGPGGTRLGKEGVWDGLEFKTNEKEGLGGQD